jgi:hypothetical protein
MAQEGAAAAARPQRAQGGGLCGQTDHYTPNLAPKPILTMRAASPVGKSAARKHAFLMPRAGAVGVLGAQIGAGLRRPGR